MADDFIFDINAYVQGNNGNILPITIRNKGAVVNITGATVRVAIKQGAYISTKQAVITDAANGKCEITLTREDLSTAGLYYYQPTITYADDREFSGDVEKFRVSGKLAGAPPVVTPGMIELSRLAISAGGKLTIDGVEQIGGGSGGTLPDNAILFEDWVGGETVTIDTSTTPTPDTTAPVLTITPSGGTFATTQGVTMTTNETATIYYTLDGSTPTVSSGTYTTALSMTATTTLKAFAKDTAGNSSAVQTVTFTKDAAAPADTTAPIVTSTPTAGTYTSAQSVSLSANETATIYYTTNGTTPTTASTVYSAPIQVSATTTLQYMAVDTAGNTSVPVASTYTINVADTTAPVLTITPAGTFTDTKTVTMSTNETATIYYTLDDTDPKVSGTKLTYTAPLTLTATDTVKAYAKDTAGNDSAVQTVTYTKEQPTFSGYVNDASLILYKEYPVNGTQIETAIADQIFKDNELWTISFSAKSALSPTAVGLFFLKTGTTANDLKMFRTDDGRFKLMMWTKNMTSLNEGSIQTYTNPNTDITTFNQITFTRVGTTFKTYLNGVQVHSLGTTADTNIIKPATPFIIGDTAANVEIKNMQFYNRALTDAEITQNYNALK